MSRHNGRGAMPFPPSARVKIIGEPDGPPAGRHYYHVPALIQRPGQSLEVDAYECHFPVPMNGVYFQKLQGDVTASLTKEGEEPPKVILLQPVFLGFVPQEEIERHEQALAEKVTVQ